MRLTASSPCARRPRGCHAPLARALAFTAAALAATAAPAQERPLTLLAGATVTFPLSGTADHFGPGPGVAAGAVWHLGAQTGLRLDGAWSVIRPADQSREPGGGAAVDVTARVQYATASFVFIAPPGRARLYVLGGAGLYRRSVRLSTTASDAPPVCNPWWFVCDTDARPASRLSGTRSTTNPGVNVGLGVVAGRVFIEGRYHYAAGPTFRTPQGNEPATGKFFGVVAGGRF